MVIDGDWLRAIIRHCEQRDIFVLLDDIYHRLVFDGRRAVHCYECTDRSVDDGWIDRVEASGRYAYVVNQYEGLWVVDAWNAARPIAVWRTSALSDSARETKCRRSMRWLTCFSCT